MSLTIFCSLFFWLVFFFFFNTYLMWLFANKKYGTSDSWHRVHSIHKQQWDSAWFKPLILQGHQNRARSQRIEEFKPYLEPCQFASQIQKQKKSHTFQTSTNATENVVFCNKFGYDTSKYSKKKKWLDSVLVQLIKMSNYTSNNKWQCPSFRRAIFSVHFEGNR